MWDLYRSVFAKNGLRATPVVALVGRIGEVGWAAGATGIAGKATGIAAAAGGWTEATEAAGADDVGTGRLSSA